MTDTPEPGTPEYDEMMAAKYRRQQSNEDSLLGDTAEDGGRTLANPSGLTIRVDPNSTVGPSHQEEHYSASMADPAQVLQLEREIAKLRQELDEVRSIDPRTGEARYAITGEARRLREIKLFHLEQRELPAVRELQQRAAAWRAAHVPTAEDKLRSEAARRIATRVRAEEIADEREAQNQAEKILAERRARSQSS